MTDWEEIAWSIFWCLLIALILGLLLGWILNWLFGKDRYARLEAALNEKENELTGLRGRLFAAEAAAGEVVLLKTRLSACHDETSALKLDNDYTKIKTRLDNLEVLATDEEEDPDEKLQARIAETELLKREISALKTRIATDEFKIRIGRLDAVAISLLVIFQKARVDQSAGIVKTRRVSGVPGIRDNLKKIVGVGPVLEKILNGLNIYTFREIAAWDDTRINEVGAKLGAFQDRIHRDAWVAQCKKLQRKHSGEKA